MKNYTLDILPLFIGSLFYGQIGLNNDSLSAASDIIFKANTRAAKASEIYDSNIKF
jgi:hypothetical protein